ALLGFTPTLLAWEYAAAQTADANAPRVIVVRPNGDGATQNFNWTTDDGQEIEIAAQVVADDDGDGNPHVIKWVAGPEGSGNIVVTADAAVQGDGRSGAKTKKIQVITTPK